MKKSKRNIYQFYLCVECEGCISCFSPVPESVHLLIIQGQHHKWRRETDCHPEAQHLILHPYWSDGNSSKGSTAQREHQPSAPQSWAAHPSDQHHQPSAQTSGGTAADPDQAGHAVQREGERSEEQGLSPEDSQRRSGRKAWFYYLRIGLLYLNINDACDSKKTSEAQKGKIWFSLLTIWKNWFLFCIQRILMWTRWCRSEWWGRRAAAWEPRGAAVLRKSISQVPRVRGKTHKHGQIFWKLNKRFWGH